VSSWTKSDGLGAARTNPTRRASPVLVAMQHQVRFLRHRLIRARRSPRPATPFGSCSYDRRPGVTIPRGRCHG
jgi:hypothetical protein